MNSYESLKGRIGFYYEPSYNEFVRLYNNASESERRAYESKTRRYLSILSRIREADDALRHFKEDVKSNTRLQALFSTILLALMLLAMWLGEHYLLLALMLVTVYITYEMKNLYGWLLVNQKEEQIREKKLELGNIGPTAEYIAVIDWQNSFNIKSDFYREHKFGSFGSQVNKEIALINIKRAILRETLNKNLVSTETLRDLKDYDDWLSIVPPSLLYESLERENDDES